MKLQSKSAKTGRNLQGELAAVKCRAGPRTTAEAVAVNGALGKDFLGRVWSFACYSSNLLHFQLPEEHSTKRSSNIHLIIAFPPCLLISSHFNKR